MTSPAPAKPRTSWLGLLLLCILVATSVFTANLTHPLFGSSSSQGPIPGYEASKTRLLSAVTAHRTSKSYTFAQTQTDSDEPVTWDPCRPIHYVTSFTGGPKGIDAATRAAVRDISAAAGLKFIDDGPTTEILAETREAYQPDRYGQHWAPVIISWSNTTVQPQLRGDVVGLGGGTAVTAPGGRMFLVSGTIWLDGPDLTQELKTVGGDAEVKAVITHELGHVVGLGHTDDSTQLMYADSLSARKLGVGDKTGLAQVGDGPCTTAV